MTVSVPSRGDWGFLPLITTIGGAFARFPSPLEVTGVSYNQK